MNLVLLTHASPDLDDASKVLFARNARWVWVKIRPETIIGGYSALLSNLSPSKLRLYATLLLNMPLRYSGIEEKRFLGSHAIVLSVNQSPRSIVAYQGLVLVACLLCLIFRVAQNKRCVLSVGE